MKHITISIPDNFYKTVVDFFRHIPEAKIESEEAVIIPDWHKEETLKRISTAKAGDFIPWKKAKKQLRHK